MSSLMLGLVLELMLGLVIGIESCTVPGIIVGLGSGVRGNLVGEEAGRGVRRIE